MIHRHVLERIRPGTRVAGPESIELPTGYAIEPVATGLNYPTAISWDPDGRLLIAESRAPLGAEPTPIRILRQRPDGELIPLAVGFDRPIADLTVYRGLLYLSQRGKISVIEEERVRDLIAGLPSWGLHGTGAIVFDAAGRLYFGQGTVSNAGIVGPLELERLYQAGHIEGHDIPGATVTLTGLDLESANPVTRQSRPTGAFVPWGMATSPGQQVSGPQPGQAASGAIMRANWDGSDLRVFAWGFRNPAGLAFGPDGRLYVANQGAMPWEPRPVAHDQDSLWIAAEGGWYGWPDYLAGRPITDPAFRLPGRAPHGFLLAGHDRLWPGGQGPARPVLSLGEQAGAGKLDFCLHREFGFAGEMFVPLFGPLLGPTAGVPACQPAGHRVVRVDPHDGSVSDWAVNRSRLPASMTGNNGGLERPVEAKFGPDGNLYIVDLGVVEFREELGDWSATPETGIVWRVTRRTGGQAS